MKGTPNPQQGTVDHGNPPGLRAQQAKWKLTFVFVVVVLVYMFTSWQTGSSLIDLWYGLPDVWRMVLELFPPNWGYATETWGRLSETIQMAIIATTVAAILCIPISLMASSNIAPNNYVYNITKQIMNILRTIPDLLLAVIFVGIFGIGAFSGIMALIIFSLGILAKLLAETIEAIDKNPLEAIRASGGNTLQVIVYGVMPQILPQYTSFTLYVFEINVRASLVLGFVGAGGIGQLLQRSISFFQYGRAMMIIIIIFVAVVIIEYISGKIREEIM
ncbi:MULTISPECIES: phosphonate ABC transporter, permease protein PhnE [Alteribacter]|uniref:Phosphonate ABC transporter, permease protein PhnE n=1 Tax=Alteribacter keqinensis TaxID=2483800 RepID=A0A3M7TS98_9BACI|nr:MULTISPECIES: phosphonate ABC transporter, permease protein PhnE [Alteribacter]MBM7097521.1 phosphonate ABC transporter, permease protein PhnE [Alteribacter salitolerans]RNA68480.1 phosphonate ABC transporter, permease protein PhnE [Alteribacter keqinensis]